jgi:DNA helicase-2/ATP-dependent DNA helicase PcrA
MALSAHREFSASRHRRADARDLADAARKGTSLWQVACAGGKPGGKANASVEAFVKLIEAMRAATDGLPLPEAVQHVNAASGLCALPQRKGRSGPARQSRRARQRRAGLSARSRSCRGRADAGPAPDAAAATGATDPLTAFLAHAALEAGETQAAEADRHCSS